MVGLTRIVAAALTSAAALWLVVTFAWALKWFNSGVTILSLLLINDGLHGALLFRSLSPWAALAGLNFIYALASTSWLQYRTLTFICWPCIIAYCLTISANASSIARGISRTLLTPVHFTRDKVAGFSLPTLHLDIGLEGLLAVGGWTLSLSTLTLEIHDIEAAYNISEELHVALYCEDVSIRLFEGIDIGAIYGILKCEKFIADSDSVGIVTENTKVYEGPLEQTSSTAQQIADNRNNYNPGVQKGANTSSDSSAQRNYDGVREGLHTTSVIGQCRGQTEPQMAPQLEQKTRAATCEKLQKAPSVSRRSSRYVKASTILNIIPEWILRLFSRMPLLLRLILMPVTYLHPVRIASASIAASGTWMASMIQDAVRDSYDAEKEDIQQFEQTAFEWMNNAYFCLDLSDIRALVHISTRASQNMESSVRSGSSMVMRIDPETNTVAPSLSVDGADASFTIPSFFLPSHEHLIPPRRDTEAEDQANIGFTAHLSFPAVMDRAMVEAFADMIESLIIMEIAGEKEGESQDDSPSPAKSTMDRAKGRFKSSVQETGRSIKKGLKKTAFASRGDGQIAWTVNKIAEQLEALRGYAGYAGDIPVALGPLRGVEPSPTKFLA